MFIGHLAVGFAAKRFAPRTSLGWLLAAPMFLDLIWPLFVLTGVEVVRIEPGNTAFTPLEFVSYPWGGRRGLIATAFPDEGRRSALEQQPGKLGPTGCDDPTGL